MDPKSVKSEYDGFDWSGLTLFLISIAGVLICLLIVWPFLPGITAAVVLAIVTERPHRWLSRRLKGRTFSATVALTLVVLSVVTPTILIVQGVGHHVLDAVRGFQSGAAEQGFRQFVGQHGRIAGALQYTINNVDQGQVFEKGAGAVGGRLAALLGHSISAFFQMILMLFILFFLYRDKKEALQLVRSMMPLTGEESEFLLARLQKAIQALVLGRFAVAGIQGLVTGVTLASLGVEGSILLGALTTLVAVVPAVGAFVVWLPIAIYLAATHHWIQAVILLAIGSLLISTLDNFLYPILVGSRLRLHTVPIFLSMLGGVWLLGVSGIILGPISFSVTAALILIWRHRIRAEPLEPDALVA